MNAVHHADVIIAGSGAGGSAAAHALARAGRRVILIEKGGELPHDGSTLDFKQVVQEGVFKSHEPWLDQHGRRFCPEEYFNVGGKTKWYGAALLRYGEHEFRADPAHQCLAWPFEYETLRPYYEQAEQLLGVREFACEPDLQWIAARLERGAPEWRTQFLPLGLSPAILEQPLEARHFDGFASVGDFKSDGETSFLRSVRGLPNLTFLTNRAVTDLLGSAEDPTTVVGVRLDDGSEWRAGAVMLAAGALHSPRLLQGYLESRNLASRLPCALNVGRHLKYHLLTAVIGLSSRRMTDLIRKTRLFSSDELPHSSVQPLGFDGELIGALIPRAVPRVIARVLGNRAYGFFLQTEDGAHSDNRVIAASPATQGLPMIDYDSSRTPAARSEHQLLVRRFKSALLRAGLLAFSSPVGLAGTAHVSGTLTAGRDPLQSVVDANGRVHGMRSLYVVDASILPRSSRVNPSLTVYAWALRVAQQLMEETR
jgi:choline dehydrogenase-like flavoprotein